MKIHIKKMTVICLALSIVACIQAQFPAEVFVTTNGTGNGSSWVNALSNIQAGVTAADPNGIVWVSNGTWTIISQITVTDGKIVRGLYGTNDPALETVIDGNASTRCFSVNGGTLENLVVRNGKADYAAGALLNPGNAMNCNFYGNFSSNTVWGYGGGAIMAGGVSLITNCRFFANTRRGAYASGSAVFLTGGAQFIDSVAHNNTNIDYYASTVFANTAWTGVIQNCRFYANSNSENSVLHLYYSHGELSGCVISNNISRGLVMQDGSNVVSNCTFIGNNLISNGNGGGVAMTAGRLEHSRIIHNSITHGYGAGLSMSGGLGRHLQIVGNTNSGASYGGGGAYIMGGTLESSVIASNTAPATSQGGGGAYFGGATISNCWIIDNSAQYGGGIRATVGALLTHSIIGDNQATNHGGGIRGLGVFRNCLIVSNETVLFDGAGIYSEGAIIESCTIAGNKAGRHGGGMYSGNANDRVINTIIYENTAGHTYLSSGSNWYNNVAGVMYTNCCTMPAGLPGDGNIYFDTQFVGGGNYRLHPTSPCVNTGILQGWMANSTDLDGRSRIDRFSGQADIGCYEHISSGAMFYVH